MQYITFKSALLAQETLFLIQKETFFAQRSPKSLGLKFSSESKLFGGCHPCSCATSATLQPITSPIAQYKCLLFQSGEALNILQWITLFTMSCYHLINHKRLRSKKIYPVFDEPLGGGADCDGRWGKIKVGVEVHHRPRLCLTLRFKCKPLENVLLQWIVWLQNCTGDKCNYKLLQNR